MRNKSAIDEVILMLCSLQVAASLKLRFARSNNYDEESINIRRGALTQVNRSLEEAEAIKAELEGVEL